MKIYSYKQLMMGYTVAHLVEVLHYKLEGLGFDSLPASLLP